jgi:hypothetical protein
MYVDAQEDGYCDVSTYTKKNKIKSESFQHFELLKPALCLCVDLEILEKNKCELISQHKWFALKDLEREDMIIFNAWNNNPDSYDQLKALVCCSVPIWFYIFMGTIVF